MSPRLFRGAALAAVASLTAGAHAQAAAYLFWMPPSFTGTPVRGDEPGIGQPMPDAKPEELRAHLLWNMRSGLNVAALQCQFSPALMTVRNYNEMLSQHGRELAVAYTALTGYFKRTAKKDWQRRLDDYTTRTYNGFSTMHAQLGFCETAASIGREVLDRPKGALHLTAAARMREFRNSLIPVRDRLFTRKIVLPPSKPMPSLDAACWNKKDELKKKCFLPEQLASAQ